MQVRRFFTFAVAAIGTLWATGALSGEHRAGTLVRTVAHPDSVMFPVVITTQTFHNDLDVYSVVAGSSLRDSKRVNLIFDESITNGLFAPVGAVTTAKGNVYVTNESAANIVVFAYNGSNFVIVKTLTDPNQLPYDVDSTPSENLIAVSNSSTTSLGNGSISLYAHGSTQPTGFLTVHFPVTGVGVAIDHNGNCFWSVDGGSSGPTGILVFPQCQGTANTVVSGLTKAGGIAFDRSDNLYYVDQGAATVYRCVGTSNCTVLASGFAQPFFIHFDARWRRLWLTDPATATIYALNPKNGKIVSKTAAVGGTSDPPFGIAPDPGSKF